MIFNLSATMDMAQKGNLTLFALPLCPLSPFLHAGLSLAPFLPAGIFHPPVPISLPSVPFFARRASLLLFLPAGIFHPPVPISLPSVPFFARRPLLLSSCRRAFPTLLSPFLCPLYPFLHAGLSLGEIF